VSEPAPTDIDGLVRRVQQDAQASPTDPTLSPAEEARVDDHADELALARRRCEEAFDELGPVEPGRTLLSRLLSRWRNGSAAADKALIALRDLVERLATRHRYDIEYLAEHLAELERRSLVAEEVARRVEVLEHRPEGAVIDLARFAAWFAPTDLVLWLGAAEGPLHSAIAGAGPVIVYDVSTLGERAVAAAVVTGAPVTAAMVGQVTETITAGGFLVVVLETPQELTAVVDLFTKAGLDSTGLTWLADDLHGVAGSLVATFHRSQER
jgi:hypothetical protein